MSSLFEWHYEHLAKSIRLHLTNIIFYFYSVVSCQTIKFPRKKQKSEAVGIFIFSVFPAIFTNYFCIYIFSKFFLVSEVIVIHFHITSFAKAVKGKDSVKSFVLIISYLEISAATKKFKLAICVMRLFCS